LAERRTARLRLAFAREQLGGLRVATYARLAALAVIAAWLVAAQHEISVVYYLGVVALFVVLTFVQLAASARGQSRQYEGRAWVKYVVTAIEMALLAAVLVNPNPLAAHMADLPPAMLVRGQNFLYFFVLLALTALSLSPAYVLWSGIAAALAWSGGVVWVILQPGTVVVRSFAEYQAMTLAERAAAQFDPDFVDVVVWQQQVLLLLVIAALLALAVARARRVVERQAVLERERAALARYFSPNLVDELTQLDNPLGTVRRQDVAVMFCDLVGFTGLAATEAPERVIGFLREHYARLEGAVFLNGGTIDKYFGDTMMATFGTPQPGGDDATRALRCARAILDELTEWNRARADQNEPAVRVGIGIHYGPAVLGNIGGERRLEFTAIGDTVNVAKRIESLTRELGVELVVSDALVQQVRREHEAPEREAPEREDGAAIPELEGLVEATPVVLRGRAVETAVWLLRQGEPQHEPAPAG
jgi:adenylate cyclase